MTNLVIVMAGNHSLHEEYAMDRDFELWVCYYGRDEAIAKRYRETCDRLFRLKGQKWSLVRKIASRVDEHGVLPFSRFEYVLLPDDDIRFPHGGADISRAFKLAADVEADIFQPAISNENFSRGWEATQANETCLCRAVPFVEIMMPGFSSQIFGLGVLPLLHVLGHIRTGWGLEPLFVRLGEALLRRPIRAFVFDATAAIHTRAVGKGDANTNRGRTELDLMPQFQANRFRELGQFKTVADARLFQFSLLDESADNAEREKQFQHTAEKLRSYEQSRGRPSQRVLQWLRRLRTSR